MQRFTSTAILTALFTATISTALAQMPAQKASAIIHSAAYPNRVKVTSATYHIGVQVGNVSLSELRVRIPKDAPARLRVGQVAVTEAGKPVNAASSFDGKEITIAFTQPVAAGTVLEIDLNGVRTSDLLGHTWQFPIYGRSVGSNQEISLGTARIQTYK